MMPCTLLLLVAAADPAPPNPLYRELLDKGVAITPDVTLKPPGPTMADGLDAAAQRAIIRKLASKYDFDDFVRPSVVAPHVLDLKADKNAQRIDLGFVAHGRLDALGKDNLVTRLTTAPPDKKAELPATSRDLTDKELKRRNLTAKVGRELQEKYGVFSLNVLDRVRVSGIAHNVETLGPESRVGALLLDPRFGDDPEFPNQWRPIIRTEQGTLTLGAPGPYAGLGGYVKATALREPAGALFIECHLVFHEPKGWFEGNPNILRAKLPLAIQENVRKLRRELGR